MTIDALIQQVGKILLGKEQQIRLAICCLLARGHLLIEDLPGVGKTTLAQALMRVTGLDYQRVQFTSDLLPAERTKPSTSFICSVRPTTAPPTQRP